MVPLASTRRKTFPDAATSLPVTSKAASTVCFGILNGAVRGGFPRARVSGAAELRNRLENSGCVDVRTCRFASGIEPRVAYVGAPGSSTRAIVVPLSEVLALRGEPRAVATSWSVLLEMSTEYVRRPRRSRARPSSFRSRSHQLRARPSGIRARRRAKRRGSRDLHLVADGDVGVRLYRAVADLHLRLTASRFFVFRALRHVPPRSRRAAPPARSRCTESTSTRGRRRSHRAYRRRASLSLWSEFPPEARDSPPPARSVGAPASGTDKIEVRIAVGVDVVQEPLAERTCTRPTLKCTSSSGARGDHHELARECCRRRRRSRGTFGTIRAPMRERLRSHEARRALRGQASCWWSAWASGRTRGRCGCRPREIERDVRGVDARCAGCRCHIAESERGGVGDAEHALALASMPSAEITCFPCRR